MEQSPSFTVTTTIYVLQSTNVMYRYEVDVLGEMVRVNGQTTVTLGTLLRDHNMSTSKGYKCLFQDAARFAYMPSGTQLEENTNFSDLFYGKITNKQVTVIQDECVDIAVPAGKFACCVKLTITNHHENYDGISDRERVFWFSPDLGWPVRIEESLDLGAKSYELVNELVELGSISPEAAAARVLSAIEDMKVHSWSTPDGIFILRKQLMSLGLLPDSGP